MDVNQMLTRTYWGDHFMISANMELSCCTIETDTVLYVNNTIKIKIKIKFKNLLFRISQYIIQFHLFFEPEVLRKGAYNAVHTFQNNCGKNIQHEIYP